MEYITIDNNLISGHFCGDIKPSNAVEVNNFSGVVGDPVNYYDDNWNRKSDIDLYKEGIKEIPTGFKFNDDKTEILEMTEIEKINAGLEKLPTGFKIENNEIVEKTIDEKLSDGDITQQEYNEIKINQIKIELDELDKQELRPVAAVINGTSTDDDKNKISEIESHKVNLRAELVAYT